MSNSSNSSTMLTEEQCNAIQNEFQALLENPLPSNHHFYVAMIPHKNKPTYDAAFQLWQKLKDDSGVKWAGDEHTSTVTPVNFGEVVYLHDILCHDTVDT